MKNEEAIARIREHMIIHKNKEPRAIYITEALKMAIKALEQTRWIPCSEKNPNETGKYFTTIKWFDRENVYKYMVVKRDYFAEVDTWNDSFVIAWMPLPEPYKAESKIDRK